MLDVKAFGIGVITGELFAVTVAPPSAMVANHPVPKKRTTDRSAITTSDKQHG
jgi:hypothetical protein